MDIYVHKHAAFGDNPDDSPSEIFDGNSFCVRFILSDGRVAQFEHAGDSVTVRAQHSVGGRFYTGSIGDDDCDDD